jgi:beta-phosphoglucomutase
MDEGWIIIEDAFDPSRLHHKETVFTMGNGYLSTRGSFEEGYPGARPATLVHGVFDDIPISYTELANCPDWPALTITVGDERFRLDRGELLAYERLLDMRTGVLERSIRWKSPAGGRIDLRFERFASLADGHVLAVRCTITPLDYAGPMTIQAILSAYADNQGTMHWDVLDQGVGQDIGWLHSRTRHSGIELGVAQRLTVQAADGGSLECLDCPGCPTVSASVSCHAGQSITLEKTVALYTSRQVDNPPTTARHKLMDIGDYAELRSEHDAAWADVWRASDVVIEGDLEAQRAVRYNLFQLLIAAPWKDDRVSIGAKSLSGFGYRGHTFWDTELFVLPFFTFTQPDVARNLLNYRYHSLEGARRKAAELGFEGAMVAWESADTGEEVTPRWVPLPGHTELVRIWTGDIEHHISADVAYGVWSYWRTSGDDAWMRRYGAEILLDTAVFWGSRVEENPETGEFELTDVIGPDEYHEHVDNNVYTNRMVQWHLKTALDVLVWLRESDPKRADQLTTELDLSSDRLQHWSDIVKRMRLLHDVDSGLMEQFEGFFHLDDVNLDRYEPRTESMQTLLGIDGANRSQVLKQPDVLMLLYVLRDHYDLETLRVNWDYYAPRTDHEYGSSLGPAIHAIVACQLGMPRQAYEHFMRAALVDLEDVRGNAADGIHAASAGAIWQAVVMGFGGVEVTDTGPVSQPCLPTGWTGLKFRLLHRGKWLDFDIAAGESVGTSRPPDGAEKPQVTVDVSCTPAIRAVVFDLDGVLTDTAELHYQAWQRLADEEGLPFDRQANEALRGVSRRDSLMLILGDRPATEERIQKLMARKNAYYLELVEGITPDNVLPGALDLLDELRAAGVHIAVGSASKNARPVIQRLGIADRIDVIADGYSVDQAKPAPDLFLHCAEQLGVPSAQCLVVEDAATGIDAGLAAGMWTVGLGPDQRVGDAHVVLPNLEGVRWPDVLADLAIGCRAEGMTV